MPSLMDKLRRIDAENGKAQPPPPEVPKASAPERFYRRSDRFPLSSFCERSHMNAEVLSDIFDLPFPRSIQPADLLFLDTETTGLSGGAGTLAFEVGLGYFSGEHFVVEQFLMRDYPEESAMLNEVASFMARFPALVTFNGRTFDIPLLQNRFLMNRVRDARISPLHADMLHASRRVWKLRLGRCTLQRLEQAVLGVSREDDLPGDQVPQTYFKYLKNGDFGPIERILEHNRQDVVSLAQLFFFLCKLYHQPETVQEADDLFSMARAMEKRGVRGKAKKCYRLLAKDSARAVAYAALARQEKREGHAERAAKLYTAMLARGDEPVTACVGLAKLHEHQLANPEQALVYTRQALLLLSEPCLTETEAVQSLRNALQYRYARLRRKIAHDANT
ncbi:MAG TPA: ribonuclease H-like domain-containing protein [Candidatus Limiplasma sp.]|nr:ribonuclease H-like domain-containing protein [Candidatus Limiplasma sp.]HPS80848.1 ribonuclease H-like domain-containing protein [Candidatus Limiplasma sp.]